MKKDILIVTTCPSSTVFKFKKNLHTKGGFEAKKCGSSFVDLRDGKTYNTVLIGFQC
jgi:transposase-like protein